MSDGCLGFIIIVIGLVIVIALFANFPMFMGSLLVIGGLIYMFTYFSKQKKKEEEQREKDHAATLENIAKSQQKYAEDFKTEAGSARGKCYQNKKICEKAATDPAYKSVSLQNELWNALHDASIPLQKLDDIVAEFSAIKEEK